MRSTKKTVDRQLAKPTFPAVDDRDIFKQLRNDVKNIVQLLESNGLLSLSRGASPVSQRQPCILSGDHGAPAAVGPGTRPPLPRLPAAHGFVQSLPAVETEPDPEDIFEETM
jgi:hypothetical protein